MLWTTNHRLRASEIISIFHLVSSSALVEKEQQQLTSCSECLTRCNLIIIPSVGFSRSLQLAKDPPGLEDSPQNSADFHGGGAGPAVGRIWVTEC